MAIAAGAFAFLALAALILAIATHRRNRRLESAVGELEEAQDESELAEIAQRIQGMTPQQRRMTSMWVPSSLAALATGVGGWVARHKAWALAGTTVTAAAAGFVVGILVPPSDSGDDVSTRPTTAPTRESPAPSPTVADRDGDGETPRPQLTMAVDGGPMGGGQETPGEDSAAAAPAPSPGSPAPQQPGEKPEPPRATPPSEEPDDGGRDDQRGEDGEDRDRDCIEVDPPAVDDVRVCLPDVTPPGQSGGLPPGRSSR